jgi:archaellum component FlaC
MNAYELADIVDRWAYKESAEYLTDAANMLRQQADRITELSKNVDELEEELLKTPQIKELSDEEIIEIRDSCYVQSGIDEWEFDDVVFAREILKKGTR